MHVEQNVILSRSASHSRNHLSWRHRRSKIEPTSYPTITKTPNSPTLKATHALLDLILKNNCPEYEIQITNPFVQVNQINAICYFSAVAFPHMLSLGFLLFSLLEKICSIPEQQ